MADIIKNISILGSTGSIGKNACQVVRSFPERFRVAALACSTSVEALAEQMREFSPLIAAVKDQEHAEKLTRLIPKGKTRILWGEEGYREAASLEKTDVVLSAMVGAAGLLPTLAAIEAKKTVALANKETLVMAGALVMGRAAELGVSILPVDSEHSAIFQCLLGQDRKALSALILTASGGPFRNLSAAELRDVTPARALDHPTWKMGPKISVDSATLMNKGLEVIEARWLFDVPAEKIRVVVHPESIVHSLVAFHDGAMMAQLGPPDMKGAIAYALSYPERLPLSPEPLSLAALGALNFSEPDTVRFPCLSLAFKALEAGGAAPAVLNAANETAVSAFLQGRIGFTRIPALIDEALCAHVPVSAPGLTEILAIDQKTRLETEGRISQSA